MKYTTLRHEIKDKVLTITLCRPDNLNAFTNQMADELVYAFNAAGENDEVRAVIVTGEGRAFCAGMDLDVEGNVFGLDESRAPTIADVAERGDDPAIRDTVRDSGGRVVLAMYDCPKPIIAAINGPAVGIGATMTLGMDIRLVSEKARIGFVFNKIGITPEACSTWFLPRIVGLSKALELCYTGEIINADAAHEIGLARSIHAPEELLKDARELATNIIDKSPVAIALTRQMMYRNAAASHPREAHNGDSLSIFYASIGDGKEGIKAFKEKRTPDFTSKVSSDMPPFYPWWE